MCDLCAYDTTYYGGALRVVEGIRICLLCYLDILNIGLDDAINRRNAETTFFCALPASHQEYERLMARATA